MRQKAIVASLASFAGMILFMAWAPPSWGAEKVIYMQAMEPKGATSADKEPFPGNTLPAGGGYVIKPPNKKGRWHVSPYICQPS
ncbi:MAG: hypothetical protein V3V62_08020, partial [bacterium]